MSKERLEEIKESVKEIMETPYGIRHIKAEEVGIDLVMTGKVDFLLQEIDLLNEQNKCYREAIENVDALMREKRTWNKVDMNIMNELKVLEESEWAK